MKPDRVCEKNMENKHLVITVHGIRTHGAWQDRLSELLASAEPNIYVVNKKYGFFTVIAYLFPLVFRWAIARRFRSELMQVFKTGPYSRIDIVAHSFGTYLVAKALEGIGVENLPKINTVIFSGSVLRSSFNWVRFGGKIHRIVNECGIHDAVLILNQILVFGAGMAGRYGFDWCEDDFTKNRYFSFGHSGYFKTNDFMKTYWLPLLTSQDRTQSHDERGQTTWVYELHILASKVCDPVRFFVFIAIPIFFFVYPILKASESREFAQRQEMERAFLELEKARIESISQSAMSPVARRSDADIYLIRGKHLLEIGDLKSAEIAGRFAVIASGYDEDYLKFMATVFVQQSFSADYDRNVKCTEAEAVLGMARYDIARSALFISEYLIKKERYAESMQYCVRVVNELDKKTEITSREKYILCKAYYNMSFIYAMMQQKQQSIFYVDRVVKFIDGWDDAKVLDELHLSLSWVYILLGLPDASTVYLNKKIPRDDGMAWRVNRAHCYLLVNDKERFSDAVSSFGQKELDESLRDYRLMLHSGIDEEMVYEGFKTVMQRRGL